MKLGYLTVLYNNTLSIDILGQVSMSLTFMLARHNINKIRRSLNTVTYHHSVYSNVGTECTSDNSYNSNYVLFFVRQRTRLYISLLCFAGTRKKR